MNKFNWIVVVLLVVNIVLSGVVLSKTTRAIDVADSARVEAVNAKNWASDTYYLIN